MKVKINPAYIILAGVVSVAPKAFESKTMTVKDRVVDTVSVNHNQHPNILVVDNFVNRGVDIDGDLFGDVPHGVVTSSIIEKGLPKANVYKLNVFPKRESDFVKLNVAQNINKLLDNSLEKIKNGKKIDAINISLGFSVKYESLSREVGFKLNPENIDILKNDVKDTLKSCNGQFMIKNQPLKEILSIIEKLEKLASQGVNVYLAAGNSCDRSFNMLTLADNCIVVGAINKKGYRTFYSDGNSIIKRWEDGNVKVKTVDNGYDITNDGKLDVPKNVTSAYLHCRYPFNPVVGTSFASPRALVKDFSQSE